jgi:hypothetical protein
MDEAALIALVRLAISCRETTGCLEYVSDKLEQRIKSDPLIQTIGSPSKIKAMMVQHVLAGGPIEYRLETREEYQDRRECWFRIRVPITGFPRPLFFELELRDDDPDYPTAIILNVHF